MDYGNPGRIVVAGDWHTQTDWALQVIWQAKELLADEDRRVILHLGDFGLWPGDAGQDYLFEVAAALDQADAQLWFVDGNHEDHARLDAMARDGNSPVPVDPGYPALAERIWWLPRGHRWTWHGRTWLALGGGVSLDRAIRTEGRDWWPQEEISDEQEAAVIAGGPADVLVAHDCPAGVRHTFPPPPAWWDLRDLARSDAHQKRLQRIANAVRPSHIAHGHLHRAYGRTCDFGYGPVTVTGLNEAGKPGNYAVLDVRTMAWEAP